MDHTLDCLPRASPDRQAMLQRCSDGHPDDDAARGGRHRDRRPPHGTSCERRAHRSRAGSGPRGCAWSASCRATTRSRSRRCCIQLGLALCEADRRDGRGRRRERALPRARRRWPRASATDHDDSVFSTRWLRGSLALLSPPRVERAGEVVPQLARVLLEGADLFAHVLVDLTGFELLGEHGSAAACMDAVALVGRAHHTREQELVELAQLMPTGPLPRRAARRLIGVRIGPACANAHSRRPHAGSLVQRVRIMLISR